MIIPQFERIRAVANTPKSEVIHVEVRHFHQMNHRCRAPASIGATLVWWPKPLLVCGFGLSGGRWGSARLRDGADTPSRVVSR